MTPKCFKTRQLRQFGVHIFVHMFTLYVGVGVSKRIPIVEEEEEKEKKKKKKNKKKTMKKKKKKKKTKR